MTSLQERLFAMQDKQYAAFQAKLTPGVPVESFIGIRVPVLRKFAKEFTKEAECKDFLQQLPHEYYDGEHASRTPHLRGEGLRRMHPSYRQISAIRG